MTTAGAPTVEVVAAAVVFIDVIKADYLPTMLDPTGNTVTVTTAGWVREHRPGWLGKNPDLLNELGETP